MELSTALHGTMVEKLKLLLIMLIATMKSYKFAPSYIQPYIESLYYLLY